MKRWFKSKTVLFNVLSGAVVIANKLNGNIIPSETAAEIIIACNLLLRFITKKAITK
jgi:uncharacterized membrane protein